MLPNSSEAVWLAIIRILTGLFWLAHGARKVMNPDFASSSGMVRMVGMAHHATGSYQNFLTGYVVPNAALFAHLVAWGETLTGLSLTLGLLTRVGGLGGMFLTLNYMLMKGAFASIDTVASIDAATFLLSAVNVAAPTGMRLGLDGLIFGRHIRASVANPPHWARRGSDS